MERQQNIHKSQIRKAKHILNRAKKASRKVAAYSEALSEDGFAELLLFCVVVELVNEDDMLVKQLAVSALYSFLSVDSSISLSGKMLQKHILERSEYFLGLIQDIVADPDGFDTRPLYCALYIYPLSDIKYYYSIPQEEDTFRNLIVNIIERLS